MAAFKKILITGGIRSGKSRYVIDRAGAIDGEKIFLATALADDEEMDQKIKKHRQDRGELFQTIEEPVYLAKAMEGLKSEPAVIVIDCLTTWVYNLMAHFKGQAQEIEEQKKLFVSAIQRIESTVIIVTNEVGMGIIADNQLSRDYTNRLGFLNQDIAQICDECILMVSGIPHWVKGG